MTAHGYRLPAAVSLALVAASAVLATTAAMPTSAAATTNPRASAEAAPARPAARYIGANGGKTLTDWKAAARRIGPLQDDRIFYSHALPATFAGSVGDQLPKGVEAVISYKTPTTNVASFVRSIPAGRRVIMTYFHEPENNAATGSRFVAEFVRQSKLIRAQHRPNVHVADIAQALKYAPGGSASDCSYIPPAAAVDYYFVDVYQHGGTTGLANFGPWLGWERCVGKLPRHEGIAEYGLTGDVNRAKILATDVAYLRRHNPSLQLWSYWWRGNTRFTDTPAVREWRAIEAGRG